MIIPEFIQNQLPAMAKEAPFSITVCDTKGIILYMNEKSARTFSKSGGKELVGKSLMGCHSDKSREKIAVLMGNASTNAYTIDKNGIKKLIYQTPWFEDGKIKGLVEFSLEIPFEMPHFKRE